MIISRLAFAGFTSQEVKKVASSITTDMSAHFIPAIHQVLPVEFLGFISRALNSSDPDNLLKRHNFLKTYLRFGLEDRLVAASSKRFLQKVSSPKPENQKLVKDLAKYLQNMFSMDYYGGNLRQEMLFGLEVIQNNTLYSLFGNSRGKLIIFSNSHLFGASEGELGEVAHTIANSKYGGMLIAGQGAEILLKLGKMPALELIAANQQLVKLFKDLLSKEPDWADKLEVFEQAIKAANLPFVPRKVFEKTLIQRHIDRVAKGGKWTKQDLWRSVGAMTLAKKEGLVIPLAREAQKGRKMDAFLRSIGGLSIKDFSLDKEVLERVKKHNSPWYPVVSLKIAKKLGYEVEFRCPDSYEIVSSQTIGTSVGFKKGDGDKKYYTELSPGPFFDPEVGNLIFEKYVEAGIIDVIKPLGLDNDKTMHFNIGIRDMSGVVSLVRALHLTGAGINTERNFTKTYLDIRFNRQTFGPEYIEAKSFDVVTLSEFEWNWISASYLGWALGACNDIWKNQNWGSPGIKWKNKLSVIWDDHMTMLGHGLESIADSKYLVTEENHLSSVTDTMTQLKFIFNEPGAHFGNLHKIDALSNTNIKPVRVGGKTWPNIAFFAREVTNKSVAKVRSVVDSIESEAKDDLKAIDKLPKGQQTDAASRFLEKYNYSWVMQKYGLGEEKAFQEIRKLLLGA